MNLLYVCNTIGIHTLTLTQISIYQITDVGLCRQTLDLFQRGVVVDVLVSRRSVSRYKEAQDCYKMLFAGGMAGHIKTGLAKFSYSHAKYWIIDNHEVHLSTGIHVTVFN